MILELIIGALVSGSLLFVFKSVNIGEAANRWILSIGKFVYLSGHPLLDDDQRFARITKQYKSVIVSFLRLVIKILLVILSTLVAIATSSLVVRLIRHGSFPDLSLPHTFGSLFPKYISHWPFIVGTLLPLASIPFLRSRRIEDYSSLDKFLHYLFVGNGAMAKLQFQCECLLHRKSVESAPRQHIYVSGLARSGSTSLMQYLGQLPDFVSLSYRNMPLIFMPRTGPRLISQRDEEKERSHKDGMKHSLSTYEALEEPFWLHWAGTDFVRIDHLAAHDITEEVHAKYRKYRTLVACDKTYLSKNNNHLLRAKSLHRMDAANGLRTRTIIPFREPYAQAKSLLEQHNTLSALQTENDFALDYMDFLVHHEFGLHVKTLCVGGPLEAPELQADPSTVEYWVDVWYRFYWAVLEKHREEADFCFFCYETYLENPRDSLLSLQEFIGVSPEQLESLEFKNWTRKRAAAEENVAIEAVSLYEKMLEGAINRDV